MRRARIQEERHRFLTMEDGPYQHMRRAKAQRDRPMDHPHPLTRELYQLLVAPIAQDLQQAQAQTLMWSLDGVLHYLPLAALHERYPVIHIASHFQLHPGDDTASFLLLGDGRH